MKNFWRTLLFWLGIYDVSLIVHVPEKYREQIMARFTPVKDVSLTGICIIKKSCPLCQDFGKEKCSGCPFKHFKNCEIYVGDGCMAWIYSIDTNIFDYMLLKSSYVEMYDFRRVNRFRKLLDVYIRWDI